MNNKLTGRVLKYGDSIDTDVMSPGKYSGISLSNTQELAKHAMEGLDSEFPEKVRNSPILVAGKNFGCGSSRERAPVALKGCGVSLILAESFGRIFFRNAINIGLPVMVCEGISLKVNEGDYLEVDLGNAEIKNISSGKTFKGERLPDFILELINSGGLFPLMKKKLESKRT